MASASSYRSGIQRARSASGPSPQPTTAARWVSSLSTTSPTSEASTVRHIACRQQLVHCRQPPANIPADIRTWFSNVEQHATEGVNKILIGNKCDWEEKRAVSTERGQALADELGIPFLEVSAKSNINVDQAFYSLASDIKKRLIDSARSDQAAGPSVNVGDAGGANAGMGGKCC